MKKIRVSIIGYGYWGPNLVRNFNVLPNVEVVWICDISQTCLKNAKLHYPHIKQTSDIQTIIRDKTVDLVALATPVSTHFPLAKKMLLARKHVLIEKPMTSSIKEAKELITLADTFGKQIFVGHTFVYSEPVQLLKKMIDRKQLGQIYYFDSVRINLGLLQSDSNVLWDLAPHDLSIISYLFSQKPLAVQTIGSSYLRPDIEELVHLFITLENSISCHIQLNWLSPIKMRNIIIAGSEKMVTYNDLEPIEKIKLYDKGVAISKDTVTPFSPAYRSGNITIPHLNQNEALFTELSHFTDCLQKNKKPLTGGKEGLEVVQLIELSELSMKKGKKIYINEKL